MAVKYTVSFQDFKGLIGSADLKAILEAVDAKVLLDAASLQMLVEVDPDTLNRYFRSGTEATLSEAASILFERPVADSFSMSDEAPTLTFNKNPSDSFGVTESIDLLIAFIREFTDSLSVSEATALSVDLAKTDSVSATEQAALDTSIPQSDSLSVSESFARAVTFSRAFTDAFSLDDFTDVDAIAKQVDGNKTNIFSMTENHAMSLSKELADSFGASELAAMSVARPVSDSFSVSESLSINFVPGASSVLNASPINGFTLNS